jgi:hypothetical protein
MTDSTDEEGHGSGVYFACGATALVPAYQRWA